MQPEGNDSPLEQAGDQRVFEPAGNSGRRSSTLSVPIHQPFVCLEELWGALGA